jgi:GT2 family glycosyltransferase
MIKLIFMDLNTLIIIVTHNSEDFIEGCLKTLILNNYSRWFLTIVDNSSKDSTVQKISAYNRNDSSCEVIQDIINTIYKKFENIIL